MAQAKTGITWTDSTWGPTTGCDRVSPGCDHCYALSMAARLKAMGSKAYQNDGDPRTSGPGFAATMHPDRLDQPIRWQKPRRIFVNSMSDLFHADVTDEFIAQVFAVMSIAKQHTFQILTKRHARMRSLVSRPDFERMVLDAKVGPKWTPIPGGGWKWPLPNVHLGVSVEDETWARNRLDALLATPAAVRFISAEPLLGSIKPYSARIMTRLMKVDWVIAGGESGPGARRMDPAWAAEIGDVCEAYGVPFFFKQTGEVLAREWGLVSRHGADPDEWPRPFRQEFPS